MQDRYAGDVGDFGKFGLLRHLCGVTADDKHDRLKPGVIWYRVADESHNADGCHICYLQKNEANKTRFRACDEKLYDALSKMVFPDNDRSIAALERADLLPNAVYYGNDVCHGRRKVTCPRADWFKSALEQTAGCKLVFVDPDNGIECADLRRTQRRSCKYVFRDEIKALVGRGQSVVVDDQIGRIGGKADKQTEFHLKTLLAELTLGHRPFGVLFRRNTVRAFLIIPNHEHRELLLERTNALVKRWGLDEWKKSKPKPHFTGPIFLT